MALPSVEVIRLGDIGVDVVRKDIRNVHLSVHPPTGRVRIAAPHHMKLDTLRVFAIAKLGWIKAQQKALLAQPREPELEFVNRESHYLWGRRYLLRVKESDAAPRVERLPRTLVLHVRPGTDAVGRDAVLAAWHRQQIRAAVPKLLEAWSPRLRVRVSGLFVQQMKTRWGSCNPAARTIRLNTELARKPRECLEYIVVHEMLHLLEPTHSARFIDLMDRHLPDWDYRRRKLNQLPVRHVDWTY